MPTRKQPVKRRATSKKRSTFKRKSRSFLPWPYAVFIFLAVGVLLAGWTFQAAADNIVVKAKVSAPLPSGPAVILNPSDGARFTEVPITVSGTCPQDTYVELYRNNLFSGTAICSVDGNFQLQVSLFPGANHLQAHVFNVTDDEGPPSTEVTVYYDVPQNPPGGGNSSGQSHNGQTLPPSKGATKPSVAVAPFELSTDFKYQGYAVGETIQWKFGITGGVPPYAINIDWGDGANSVISRPRAGNFLATHQYKKPGNGNKNSYVINVAASDSAGRKTSLQLFTIINSSGLPSVIANTLPSKPPGLSNNFLWIAWPAYGVLVLMVGSFWLGEREEFIELKGRGLNRKRHA